MDGGYQAWSDRMQAKDRAPLVETLQDWLAAQQFPAGNVNAVIENATTPLMKASTSDAATWSARSRPPARH